MGAEIVGSEPVYQVTETTSPITVSESTQVIQITDSNGDNVTFSEVVYSVAQVTNSIEVNETITLVEISGGETGPQGIPGSGGSGADLSPLIFLGV